MKKFLLFILALTLTFVFVGCKEDPVYTLELEAEKTTIKVGETTTVYFDTDKPNPEVEWVSSDTTIATVNQVGIVTGVNVGTVTITAKVKDVGEESVSITVIEKDMTANEVKTLLTSVLNEYISSKNGSIKITAKDANDTLTSELVYNYDASGNIISMMVKMVVNSEANSERHVYVKDGYSYNLVNNTKVKRELTQQEIANIISQYSQEEFLSEATLFYNEQAFYNALEFISRDNEKGTVTFKLNLANYNGSVFNTVGADEISLVVTIANEKAVKVEVNKKVGTQTNSVTVEYRGTTPQSITYPTDLDSYQG